MTPSLCLLLAYTVGEGNGIPLQYSCLENPMDGGAWWAAVHGVAMSRTRLSDFTFTFHFHALEKEMATHSSVLALENPRDGGAWWPAVSGVAWSRTQLKRLSRSRRREKNIKNVGAYSDSILGTTTSASQSPTSQLSKCSGAAYSIATAWRWIWYRQVLGEGTI